jgi:hypothetical protein
MAAQMTLPGIRYPTRAERLDSEMFEDYKVFVDFWNPLTERLIESYRTLHLREEASIIGIHAPQGGGKSAFARQLVNDYEDTRASLSKGTEVDSENLWHRIASGGRLDAASITTSTGDVDVEVIRNEDKWADRLAKQIATRGKRAVVILDNAENVYFVRGLVRVAQADLIALRQTGGVVDPAAEELVRLARTDLAGAMLILLTNDRDFLDRLAAEVERRHEELMTVLELPLPDSVAKEKVVRVNTNRLNAVTYWACLDRAGPKEKESVRERLLDATTFPRAFGAVDRAIKSAPKTRTGRPAKRNLISLLLLTDDTQASVAIAGATRTDEVQTQWCASAQFDTRWAPRTIGQREADLLESEWLLRVVVLGRPFVQALVRVGQDEVERAACKALLEAFYAPLGGTSSLTDRQAFREKIESLIEQWPDVQDEDLSDFWSRGQTRSLVYEPALKSLFPSYNTGSPGFLDYRPDLIVSDFVPCSILAATSRTAIPDAIQRNGHVVEFTATRSASADAISGYLDPKLLNYVRITSE